MAPHPPCPMPEAAPGFLFINCSLAQPSISQLAPASYARTLIHLRWAGQSTSIMGSNALHSMKSTMLAAAAAAQLGIALYSWDDTFDSLRLQGTLARQVAAGWGPSRMARGGQAPLPEPPFSITRQPPPQQLLPADLTGGPWAIFTSRHEQLHSIVQSSTDHAVHAPCLIAVRQRGGGSGNLCNATRSVR